MATGLTEYHTGHRTARQPTNLSWYGAGASPRLFFHFYSSFGYDPPQLLAEKRSVKLSRLSFAVTGITAAEPHRGEGAPPRAALRRQTPGESFLISPLYCAGLYCERVRGAGWDRAGTLSP